jgi:UDP-glucuronate 4-epimerase
MATLITGGAGFIGSRLAVRLIQLGEEIIVLDNFNDYYNPAIKRANILEFNNEAVIIEGDIRDKTILQQIFETYSIRRVAHLAALAGVRSSVEEGPLYADVNVTGSVNLMDAARKHNVHLFLQASTSSVYGQTQRIPFREEDAPDEPLAPYPATKRAAEILGHTYHHLFGLNVTVLRFFNAYGPHGRPDMMPIKVIEHILQQKLIEVYDEGKLQRDWTYIDDIVDGVVAALEQPLGYAVINLGHGSPLPLTDFILIYERLIGKKAITRPAPAPASEPRITYCDNRRARELLGFSPKVPIQEGLARTWAWYKQQHNLQTPNS